MQVTCGLLCVRLLRLHILDMCNNEAVHVTIALARLFESMKAYSVQHGILQILVRDCGPEVEFKMV